MGERAEAPPLPLGIEVERPELLSLRAVNVESRLAVRVIDERFALLNFLARLRAYGIEAGCHLSRVCLVSRHGYTITESAFQSRTKSTVLQNTCSRE